MWAHVLLQGRRCMGSTMVCGSATTISGPRPLTAASLCLNVTSAQLTLCSKSGLSDTTRSNEKQSLEQIPPERSYNQFNCFLLFKEPKCSVPCAQQSLVHILSRMNPLCILRPCFHKINFNLVISYSRNSPHFMEPKSSSPHSRQFATCPYLSQIDPVHDPHPTS